MFRLLYSHHQADYKNKREKRKQKNGTEVSLLEEVNAVRFILTVPTIARRRFFYKSTYSKLQPIETLDDSSCCH
jgi:hypothetical protein